MKEQTKLNDKTRPSNTPRGGTAVRVQQTQPLTHLVQLARERPEKLTAVHLTQLHSVLGNRAVNRLVNQRAAGAAQTSQHAPSLVIQPKLQVNAVGDKYEQEADAVAKEVVQKLNAPQTDAVPTHAQRQIEGEESIAQRLQRQDVPEEDELQLQRQEIEDEELQLQRQELEEEEPQEMAMLQREAAPEEEELQLQRQELPQQEEIQLHRQELEEEDRTQLAMTQRQPQDFTHGGPVDSHIEAQINQSRGGGQPMEDSIRQPMEQAFGADFSDVRIHTDTQAHNLNEAIQARAFTTGNDIYFKGGEYIPGNSAGKDLLTHELTHVVQQINGSKTISRNSFYQDPYLSISRPPQTLSTYQLRQRLKELKFYLLNQNESSYETYMIQQEYEEAKRELNSRENYLLNSFPSDLPNTIYFDIPSIQIQTSYLNQLGNTIQGIDTAISSTIPAIADSMRYFEAASKGFRLERYIASNGREYYKVFGQLGAYPDIPGRGRTVNVENLGSRSTQSARGIYKITNARGAFFRGALGRSNVVLTVLGNSLEFAFDPEKDFDSEFAEDVAIDLVANGIGASAGALTTTALTSSTIATFGAYGATIGSAAPVVGTIIGLVVGVAVGAAIELAVEEIKKD